MGKELVKLSRVLGLFIVMVLFQNCGEMQSNQANNSSFSGPAYFKMGKTGLQKLSKYQLKISLEEIFSVDLGTSEDDIPADPPSATYFRNDSNAVAFNLQIIENYHKFALSYSKKLIADQNWFTQIAQCNPMSPADEACLRQLILNLGLKLLRRPVGSDEADDYVLKFSTFSQQDNDFFSGVEAVLMMFLQHPEFIYRIEKVVGGVLDDYSIASRMSFFVWGSFPDDELYNAAASGKLQSATERLMQVERMLNDPKALRQVKDFHARWFGYDLRVLPANIDQDARLETEKLLEKVLFEQKLPWLEIFNSNETYLTPNLAQHYGMTLSSNQAGWVNYQPNQRGGGLLSHATIASLGDKFNDTSPTLRGYELFKRLFCGELEGTIPPGVDVDFPPGDPNECKEDTYFMRGQAVCAKCHAVMDNIGFGLENIGAFGEYRKTQVSNSSCNISGQGSYKNKNFIGPTEFGKILTNNQEVRLCLGRQLFESFVGRKAELDDEGAVRALQQHYDKGPSYQEMIKFMIQSEEIKYKN